jgi:chromosome segregation ATPase
MPRPVEYGPQSAAPGDEKLAERIRQYPSRLSTIRACPEHPGCIERTRNGVVTHEDAFTSLRATEGQLEAFQEATEEMRRLVATAVQDVESARRSFASEVAGFRQESARLRTEVAALGGDLRRRLEDAEATLRDVQSARRSFTLTVEASQKEASELRAEVESLGTDLRQRVSDAEAALREVGEARRSFPSQVEAFSREATDLRTRVDNLAVGLHQRLERAETALEDFEQARGPVTAEVDAFRKEAENLRSSVAGLGQELRKRIEYAEAEIGAEIEQARRKANKKVGELVVTKAELRRELEDLLRSVEQESERLKNKIEAVKAGHR